MAFGGPFSSRSQVDVREGSMKPRSAWAQVTAAVVVGLGALTISACSSPKPSVTPLPAIADYVPSEWDLAKYHEMLEMYSFLNTIEEYYPGTISSSGKTQTILDSCGALNPATWREVLPDQ